MYGLQRFVDGAQSNTGNTPMSLVMLHKVRLCYTAEHLEAALHPRTSLHRCDDVIGGLAGVQHWQC
jgi:hypothetical protein